MTPRQREQMREWKRRRAFGVKSETWREQYEVELEKFLAWCVLVGVPFKWAMMRAMQAFMLHGRHVKREARAVVAADGRTWPSINAAARDLGVTKNAVFGALTKRHLCKGVRLTYEQPPRRLTA